MRKLLTLLLLFSFVQVRAQEKEMDDLKFVPICGMGVKFVKGKHIAEVSFISSETNKSHYSAPNEYTAIVIGSYARFGKYKLVVGEDTFDVIQDEHYDMEEIKEKQTRTPYQSTPIIVNKRSRDVYLLTLSGRKISYGLIYFINVPKLSTEISQPQPAYKRGNCPEPTTVSYNVWRSGLDAPKPGRVATDVEHMVIHHSATSNAQTNYTEVIRNIYVYHTEVNGWDDIGYNYVVAPDGTIFLGRDPQGAADHDNILGAHFCSKNSNTMGICMMGTYTDVAPSNNAINALTDLLTWKAEKEHLYPFGQSIHPKSGGSMLANVAGHRDGCATECPGTQTYNMLPAIRDEVLTKLEACGIFVSIDEVDGVEVLIYPNPSNGVFTIEGIKIGTGYSVVNSLGQTVITGEVTQKQEQLNLTAGLYYFITNDGYRKKLVVR